MTSEVIRRGSVPALLAAFMLAGAQHASAQTYRTVSIPADTVVRVKLNDDLSSKTAREGQRFTATLDQDDNSGFPLNTRFEGTVTDVQRHAEGKPGVLNMRFNRVILPDGRALAVNGRLASLDADSVRRAENGRLESKSRSSNLDLKWVGYGAAGGAVLSTILGGNFLKGALLGGLGGAVYGYLNRDKAKFRDVHLEEGTEFGVALEQRVAFQDRPAYRYTTVAGRYDDRYTDRYNDRYNDRYTDRYNDRYTDRYNDRYTDRYTERYDDRYDERVAGTREDRFGRTLVYLNGRQVTFNGDQPLRMNGTLYVPLAPVADAAGMDMDFRRGDDTFVLHTRDGAVRGYVNDPVVRTGTRSYRLQNSPVTINQQVFVPIEFLNRAGFTRTNWDERNMRLDLETETFYRQ